MWSHFESDFHYAQMYFFWLLVTMAFLESDGDFLLMGLTQESREIDITSFTDEEDNGPHSILKLCLDAAHELGGQDNSKNNTDFESVHEDSGLHSQLEQRRSSDLPDGNSPKRVRSSGPQLE